MDEKLVTYDQEGDIALIGLNRAEKHNALSRELQAQLKSRRDRELAKKRASCVLFTDTVRIFGKGLTCAKRPPG